MCEVSAKLDAFQMFDMLAKRVKFVSKPLKFEMSEVLSYGSSFSC